MTSERWKSVFFEPGVVLLALAIPLYSLTADSTPTGREIMETQRKILRLDDEEELRLMIMINASGQERRRKLAGYGMMTSQDQQKMLLRFESPPDIRNTSLLVWEDESGDADQWLYLPAFRKVKRIPSSGIKNRFMGTDFAYEDLRREAIKLHQYELIGSEAVNGRDAFVVEATPATDDFAEDSGYSKRKLWIDKERYSTLKEEFYDKAGRLWKVLRNRDFVNIHENVWAPDEVEMHDVQANTKTIVIIEERKVNQGLSPRLFTELGMRRAR